MWPSTSNLTFTSRRTYWPNPGCVVISPLPRGVNCHRTRKLFNLHCKSPSNPNHDTLAPFSEEEVELIGGEVLSPGFR